MKKLFFLFSLLPLLVSAQISFSPQSLGFEERAYGSIDYATDPDANEYIIMTGFTEFNVATDIIIAKTSLYMRSGTGSWVEVSTPFIDVAQSSALFVDLNGDGYPDVFITGDVCTNSVCHEEMKIYINNQDGTFTESSQSFPVALRKVNGFTADLNNDGRKDVVFIGVDGGSVPYTLVYRNNGDGTVTEMATNLPDVGYGYLSVGPFVTDDFSGPSNPNQAIIITGYDGGATRYFHVYENLGNFNFSLVNSFVGLSSSSHVLADFNGDGVNDIIAFGANSNVGAIQSKMYIGDGLGNFTVSTLSSPSPDVGVIVLAYDVDNDGDLDLYLFGADTDGENNAKVYENAGDGTFSLAYTFPDEVIGASAVLFDSNSDGIKDLLYQGDSSALLFSAPLVSYQENTSTLGVIDFGYSSFNVYPNPTSGAVFIDIDREVKEIKVLNSLGQEVFVSRERNFNIDHLTAGLYYVRILAEDGSIETQKLIKN